MGTRFWTRLGRVVSVAVVAVALVGCTTGPGTPVAVGSDCGSPPTIAAGASLFGCNLSGAGLAGVDLSGADLRGAILTGADLQNANLSGADLTGANLTGANLTGANLEGAVLAGAILIGALFVNAILSGASFNFGVVYGPDGNGGGSPTGGSCSGPYCPGYNGATVDTGHPVCDPTQFVHVSHADLLAYNARSVVVDGTTSFAGAVFDYSASSEPSVILLRGLAWSDADFSGATFVNANFACQQGSGARFAGATFTSTDVGDDSSHWYAVDFPNSDFSNTTWTGVVMSDVDFDGSDFHGTSISNWVLENALDFDNDGQPDDGFVPDPYLLRLDGVDFSGSQLGVDVNPGTGSALMELSGYFDTPFFSTTSWAGADLQGAVISSMLLTGADLTGVTATGATVRSSVFDGANFSGGWSGAIWPDPAVDYSFTGATCPDGSAYDAAAPCLPA